MMTDVERSNRRLICRELQDDVRVTTYRGVGFGYGSGGAVEGKSSASCHTELIIHLVDQVNPHGMMQEELSDY